MKDETKSAILENAPVIIAVHDLEHRMLWANAAYREATGLSLKEIEGKKCYSVWGLPKVCRNCPVTTALETGERTEAELTPQNQDNWPETQGSWLSKAAPIRDEDSRIIGAVEVAYNISDRKEAETQIKRLNEELEERVCQRTAELQKAEQVLQAANQQLEASNQQLTATEQQLRASNQQLEASNQQLTATEQQLRASNQQLEASNQQLRATEESQKRLLHDMRERVKELQCMFGVADCVQKRSSLPQVFQEVADLIPPSWHYPDITRGKVIFDKTEYISAPFEESEWKQSSDIVVDGKRRGSIEVYYLQEMPRLDEGPFMKEERDLIDAMAKALSEAIGRRYAAIALERSEANLRSAQEVAHCGSWHLDLNTYRLTWSDETYRIFGLRPQEFEATYDAFLAAVHPDDREAVDAAYSGSLRNDKDNYEIRHRIVRNDTGETRYVEEKCVHERDVAGKIVGSIGTVLDITDRISLEAQLRQSQKLESIGTLAGGVAHEINNPVMGIMNYAQLILDKLGPDHEVSEFAREIGKETERVSTIVKNLLSFARHDKQSHSKARVCDIIETTLSLVRVVMRHDQITLEVDVPEDLPEIKCRSQQIQQVIMNLLTNACDALNEKYSGYHENKKILVSAREVSSVACRVSQGNSDADSTPDTRHPTRYIRLTVEDHGAGIPDVVRDRIFDPFFTTKPRDKGTGLGLSISHGIVKDHHGELSVESEPGRWTRFHMDLPISDGG